jgi:hypothetical protein
MASEYRDKSDFPKRGLTLRSWPDLARVMLRNILYAPCDHEFDSPIVDQLVIISMITGTLSLNSIIVDKLNINSLIC